MKQVQYIYEAKKLEKLHFLRSEFTRLRKIIERRQRLKELEKEIDKLTASETR